MLTGSLLGGSAGAVGDGSGGRRVGFSCRGGVGIVVVVGGKSLSIFAMFARVCRRMAARSTDSLLGNSAGSVEEGLGESRDASGCRGIVVVGVGGGKSWSRFAMFARICRRMAARSTGSRLGGSTGAFGKGLGGIRGVSGCRGDRAVVVVSIGCGKSRSSFAIFSRICCRMAARSTGSLFGSSVAVEERVGGEGLYPGCCGGVVVVVVGVGVGKSLSRLAMFARI